MKKEMVVILGLFLLLVFVPPVQAAWIAYADFTSCPRKYFPNTSGQDGPFSSAAACQAAITKADAEQRVTCVRYSCRETGQNSSDSSSGSAAPGHELDKHIGDAVAAGMSGQISGADAVGLVGLGIMGNALLGSTAPETPQQAAQRVENQRLQAEQAARAANIERIREANYQMEQDAKAFALMDLADPEFKAAVPVQNSKFEVSQAFTKGFEHARDCISQNSGAACAGSKSETCIPDYRAGYDAGKKDFKLKMAEAFQAGQSAGANGERINGGAHKGATGKCRTEWIQEYDRGYWAGQNPRAKK